MAQLSIIMGVYNGEVHLQESIESIQNQTFNDWEFIIYNDASTDSSREILEKAASQDSRIKLFSGEINKGLSAGLNYCISKSSTNLLVRQDADDISYPNRLEILFNEISQRPQTAVLSSSSKLITKNSIPWGANKLRQPQNKNWIKGSQIIHASSIMKKDLIIEAGLYDPKAVRVEDYDLWVRLIKSNYKIEVLDQELYGIRWDDNDYSRKKFFYRLYEVKVALKAYWIKECPWYYLPFIFKPIIVGFLPKKILFNLHKKRFRADQ